MKNTATILKEFIRVIIGLAIFAYGVHLTIAADIGVAPWDCLGQGIANHTPLNYGLAMTLVSVCVLIIDFFLKQPVGYGMIIDALLTGNLVQLFNDYGTASNALIRETLHLNGAASIIASCLMIVVGIVFMSAGMAVYMGAGETCGPRDSLMVGLGRIFNKIPIGIVQNGILVIVFVIGWILGGSVGVGTVFSVFATGIVMEAVFKLMHFDPKKVRHRSFPEATRMLMGH